MKLQIVFSLEQTVLPIDYYSIFYSFFKQALEKNNKEKYDELYENPTIKNFCFSLKLDSPVFKRDMIELGSPQVIMTFHDYNQIELFDFYNAFLLDYQNDVIYPMNHNCAKIVQLSVSKLQVIKEKTLYIKMQSPLALKFHNPENNKDWYYTYVDDEFSKILKDNIANVSSKLGYQFDLSDFEIIPVNPRRTVINLYGISFPVSLGSYILKGNALLLDFLYQAGIGSLRSSGCGLFEIIGKE